MLKYVESASPLADPGEDAAEAVNDVNDEKSLDRRGLDLLENEDVGGFNALRQEHPSWRPNFSRERFPEKAPIFLEELNLAEVNLVDADIGGIYLVRINLTNADLRRANMSDAVVVSVDLTGTDLRGIVHDGTIGLPFVREF
mgnify:CR=1 FL=1